MTNQIPAAYYKRAAEIMGYLPDVDFMNIVAVLFAHDTWIDRQNALVQPILELPPEKEAEPAEEPEPAKNKRLGRKRTVRAVIDGKTYGAPSRYDLLHQLGISDCYNELFHAGRKQTTLHEEAERFARKLKSLLDVTVTEYFSYGFDGKFYRVVLKDSLFQYEEESK